MRNCISAASEKANKDACNPRATEVFDQYIGNMAGNTLELMCSEYDSDSDRCIAIKKLPFDQAKAKPPKSLIVAFGDLLLADPTSAPSSSAEGGRR